MLGQNVRWLLVISFLGSFTTFSALGYETVAMLRDGQFALAALNASGNFVLGIGAVVLGGLIVRAVAA
jgi:CrcB protein